MAVRFHRHAQQRIQERGVTEDEATATVEYGERSPAKFGRTGFRRNFPFGAEWHGRQYSTNRWKSMRSKMAQTGW